MPELSKVVFLLLITKKEALKLEKLRRKSGEILSIDDHPKTISSKNSIIDIVLISYCTEIS